MIKMAQIGVANLTFSFSLELVAEDSRPEIKLDFEQDPNFDGLNLIHFTAIPPTPNGFSKPPVLTIEWVVPIIDIHGFYSVPPAPEDMAKLPYFTVRKQSAAHKSMPYVSLFHRSGENRFALGMLDQLGELNMTATLSEVDCSYHFEWRKTFENSNNPGREWSETLFVSTQPALWTDVLKSYVNIVDRLWPQPLMPVPEIAFEPVFCTWTAIHHDLNQEWVVETAKIAADLGFGNWITDDGWFLENAKFGGYDFTGDWQPYQPKFPDFGGQVKAVQALGMRYLLWVSPFMVGQASQAHKHYSTLLGETVGNLGFRNLLPDYPEVSEIISNLLGDLVTKYGLDGFKLDFIDSLPVGNGVSGEKIYQTLSKAIDRLLQYKPDLLIEFRNSYTNLASRRYANLYRAWDVPLNDTLNRWQVATLRLLATDRAVLLDPVFWHPDDSDENVAVHLISALTSVPMVSIDFKRYPSSHLELIRYWISFYREHLDVLVHGDFKPEFHQGHLPLIRFQDKDTQIVSIFDDCSLTLDEIFSNTWILKCFTRPFIEVLAGNLKAVSVATVRNKFGETIRQEKVNSLSSRLYVEIGGSVHIVEEV